MFTKTFSETGTFQALYAAQVWLAQNGYSYGSSCVLMPVLKVDFLIAKWNNLTGNCCTGWGSDPKPA